MQQLSQAQINIITKQQPSIFHLEGKWHLQKTITSHLTITGEGKTMEEAAQSFAIKCTDHHTTNAYDHPTNEPLG